MRGLKPWQRGLILAATPTVSILHGRWIAHVLVHPWDSTAQGFAFVGAIVATIIAGVGLFVE